jgi:GNAT superfamily N-acetyltransferase
LIRVHPRSSAANIFLARRKRANAALSARVDTARGIFWTPPAPRHHIPHSETDRVTDLPELHAYPRHHVPRDVAVQIRAYARVQWPFLYRSQKTIWDYTPHDRPTIDFVITDGEILVSHAAVNWRDVPHADQTWRVYGLSSVFTYPDWRKGGYGSQVVRAATQHILAQPDADLAMLFCAPRLEPFYTAAGWTPAAGAHILYGDPASPSRRTDNLAMMLFVSDRARAARPLFETQPVYVGDNTW